MQKSVLTILRAEELLTYYLLIIILIAKINKREKKKIIYLYLNPVIFCRSSLECRLHLNPEQVVVYCCC